MVTHRHRAEDTPNNFFSFIFFSHPPPTIGVDDGSNGFRSRKSNQRTLTGQLDWGRNCGGRGATGGKIFNGRRKNRKDEMCCRLDCVRWCDRSNFSQGQINLTVRKQGYCTMVFQGRRVGMDQIVQCQGSGHRVQH